ncbi:hypothetical protein CK203_083994 [Vitis vinifera]|uniref:Uncharacterized protein n=1 Tax=Vitis vinifera TaxID=29760 RepID=A0A438EUW0_VITVI|nr:hypothetical protein CK203_083994 [Vitis vinifera]
MIMTFNPQNNIEHLFQTSRLHNSKKIENPRVEFEHDSGNGADVAMMRDSSFSKTPNIHVILHQQLDQSPKPLHQSLRLERASDHLLQTSHKRQLQIVVKYEEPTSRMPINCQCNDPSPSNGAQMLTQSKNHSFKNLHLRIGSKISETVKGKLRLGTRILQLRGPYSRPPLYLNSRLAFFSERSIRFSSPNGEFGLCSMKKDRESEPK